MPIQISPPGRPDRPGAGSDHEQAAGEPTPGPIHIPAPAVAAIAARALRAEDLTPAETPPGQRPFVGFERERGAYARLKPELLARAAGRYVVLVGEEIEGPVDTFEDALRAGWRRFGLGPLYVQQVLADDRAPAAAGDPSCRPQGRFIPGTRMIPSESGARGSVPETRAERAWAPRAEPVTPQSLRQRGSLRMKRP